MYVRVYDEVWDIWSLLCEKLRKFAHNEVQHSVRAMIKDPNNPDHQAMSNFAHKQKDDLNKDINFYTLEVDALIKQDIGPKCVDQFNLIRKSFTKMYNVTTMTFRKNANLSRPAPLSGVPIPPSSPLHNKSRMGTNQLTNPGLPQMSE